MDTNYMIEVKGISKEYPGVSALTDVSIGFRAGEVHALIGENGAGKSTLMKIISGAEVQSKGSVFFNGKEMTANSPKQALELGIGTIYQEFNLFPELTVAENLFIGKEIKNKAILNEKQMTQKAQEIIDEMGISLCPNDRVKDLTVAYQQIVEICKVLLSNVKVLIMDEPTAPLTNTEVKVLFRLIQKLKEKNVAIIYVSHRMEEIFTICDVVSVLRDGCFIKTLPTKNTERNELIQLMVGREVSEVYPKRKLKPGVVALRVDNISVLGELDKVSLQVRKGEILGIAGLVGAGRTELARAIFGADKIDNGEVFIQNKKVKIRSPKDAIHARIGLVTEDRKRLGLILNETIRENISLASIKKYCKYNVVFTREEKKIVTELMEKLQIKTPSINQLVKNLSGGNQQKVVLAKWIAADVDVLIFDEPTRGIDVNSKFEIYKLMCELADQGTAIIMISSDMPELIGMSDRIMVMCEGRMAGELSREEVTQEKILHLASKEANSYEN